MFLFRSFDIDLWTNKTKLKKKQRGGNQTLSFPALPSCHVCSILFVLTCFDLQSFDFDCCVPFPSSIHSTIPFFFLSQGSFFQKSTESKEKSDLGIPCKSMFYVLSSNHSPLFLPFSSLSFFDWVLTFASHLVFSCFLSFQVTRLEFRSCLMIRSLDGLIFFLR